MEKRTLFLTVALLALPFFAKGSHRALESSRGRLTICRNCNRTTPSVVAHKVVGCPGVSHRSSHGSGRCGVSLKQMRERKVRVGFEDVLGEAMTTPEGKDFIERLCRKVARRLHAEREAARKTEEHQDDFE